MFNLIEKFVYFLGWMRFVISPLLLFGIGGFVFYLKYKGNFGLIGGISIAVVGLALGILWAESIRRKNDTMDVLAGNNRFSQGWRPDLFYHMLSKKDQRDGNPSSKKRKPKKK